MWALLAWALLGRWPWLSLCELDVGVAMVSHCPGAAPLAWPLCLGCLGSCSAASMGWVTAACHGLARVAGWDLRLGL